MILKKKVRPNVFRFKGIDFLTTHINNILSRHSSYKRRQFYDQSIGKSYDTTPLDVETLEVGSVRAASRQFVSIRYLVRLVCATYVEKLDRLCFIALFFRRKPNRHKTQTIYLYESNKII